MMQRDRKKRERENLPNLAFFIFLCRSEKAEFCVAMGVWQQLLHLNPGAGTTHAFS